ncbi:MAG: hypothetical protein ACHQX4_08820, partial [Gemmatimonadales bacterium]
MANTPRPVPDYRTPASASASSGYTGASSASSRGPAAPAPTPAPVAAAASMPSASAIDVSGSWSGTVNVRGQTIGLDMNLARSAAGQYTGDVAPQGAPAAPLRSLTLDGTHLVMVFTAPDGGAATFDTRLTADRQAITG